MAANGEPKALSSEARTVLNEGIGLILYRWTALQAAVENEWGGRDSRRKAELLISDIYSWFLNTKETLYIDDLESILEDGLLSLNTMVEDGSIEEVSENLMILHEECLEGNFQTVEKMKQKDLGRTGSASISKAQNVDDDDDEDVDDEIVNGSANGMRVDASNIGSMVGGGRRGEEVAESSMIIDERGVEEQMTEAEDGWTVVSSRRNKGKRK